MEAVFTKIENATVQELQEIMAEVEERFAVAFPQWEVLYFAVPKEDWLRRKEILHSAIALLEQSLSCCSISQEDAD